MADTVEWGSDDSRPDRGRRFTLGTPPRNPKAVTGGLAALGFLLLLIGEVLPWLEMRPVRGQDLPAELDTTPGLTEVASWQAPAYYIGLIALLALTALALAGRPRARLGAAAAAVGVAAGQSVLLAGLYTSIQKGGQLTGLFGRMPEGFAQFHTGDGFYSATAGIVLVTGAAVLAAQWSVAARPTAPAADNGAREPAEVEPAEWAGQPADLTVAPAAPFQVPPQSRPI
ncbi:MAG: hypothetical protein FWJ93_05470 [Micromonosporaceae bacterium]